MFARVSTYEGPVDKIDEGLEYAKTQVLPRARQMDGWRGILTLIDRTTGKEITVTLWDSEDALRASEEQAKTLRTDAAEHASQAVRQVDRYEVAIIEV
jgi:heme-degrading monooxygenase HmoA